MLYKAVGCIAVLLVQGAKTAALYYVRGGDSLHPGLTIAGVICIPTAVAFVGFWSVLGSGGRTGTLLSGRSIATLFGAGVLSLIGLGMGMMYALNRWGS